jgi:hypothetical protein
MASSKSAIKTIDKVELYYNKYSYKASITTPNVHRIRKVDNILDFTTIVTEQYDIYDSTRDRYPNGWYRPPPTVAEHDFYLVEYLIDLKNNLSGADVKFRHEYNTFTMYSNDTSLIDQLTQNTYNWKIEKAETSPAGVKYFKRTPPAKYRAYMTNNKLAAEFKSEFLEYMERTPDIRPSNAFERFLHRSNYSSTYLWNTYFIDYDDDKNLMMIMLMFPGAIGKKYKLEKK